MWTISDKAARDLLHTAGLDTIFVQIYMDSPQGCQKMCQDPLNMPFEVWCANITPKLKNIQITVGFFDIFFQF